MEQFSSTERAAKTIDTLRAIAQGVSERDRERQLSQPEGWLEVSGLIVGEFTALKASHQRAETEGFLIQALELFDSAGLRSPCRAALACLSQVNEQFGPCEAWRSLAARELSKPFTIPALHPPTEALLWANELSCWSAARTLFDENPSILRPLSEAAVRALQRADLSWREAPANVLWRMHRSAAALSAPCLLPNGGFGTECSLIATASRHLTEFLGAILSRQPLHSEPPESPLRPLSYSPTAALDEYIDLTLRERQSELETLVSQGNADLFRARGLEVGDCIGRIISRAPSARAIEQGFSALLEVWQGCWRVLRFSPPAQRESVLSVQASVVSSACAGFLLALEHVGDPCALGDLALSLMQELSSIAEAGVNVPASGMAPLKLVVGRAWERAWRSGYGTDAAESALQSYAEATRLFMQLRFSPRMSLSDAVASAERMAFVRELAPDERGFVELAHGNLAFRASRFQPAYGHFVRAVASFREVIEDPDLPGLHNLTLLAARACKDAAEASLRLGDALRNIYHLNEAADVIESAARLFRVQATRQTLLSKADSYRNEAAAAQKRLQSS